MTILEIEKYENILFKRAESVFSNLQKTTNWFFVALISASVTSNYLDIKKETVTIFAISVPTEFVGTSIYIILTVFNFKILKLLNIINYITNNIETRKTELLLTIRIHQWILNPFSETDSRLKYLFDNYGYSIFLIMWEIGLLTGIQFLWGQMDDNSIKIGMIFFFTFSLLSLFILIYMGYLIIKLNGIKAMITMKFILIFWINQFYK